MPKSEFPNIDPSSSEPEDRKSDGASQQPTPPSFEIDSELGSAEKDTTEPSYPELFPMPGMTVDSSNLHFSNSASEEETTSSKDLSPKSQKDNAIEFSEAFAQEQKTEEPQRQSSDDPFSAKFLGSDTDVSETIAPPFSSNAEASSSVDSPNNLSASGSSQSIDLNKIQENAEISGSKENDTDTELDSSLQSKIVAKAGKEKKPKKSRKNPFLEKTQRVGKKVSGHPVAQRITAFTGWPWVIALGVSGATTVTAFSWLAGLPPVPNCKIPSSSWTDAGRLYCADQAARTKKPEALASALEMVGDWNKDDPLYDQVNKLSDDWSRSIIDVAERELDQGKLNEAIKLVNKVPKSSSYYDESQATIKDWQSNWKDGEKILEKARDAIQEQDWAVATDQMRQLVQLGGEHWQKRADKLISEMTIEQEAFRKLNVANDRAGADTVADIQSAIQLATKIDAKRLARKKLVSYVDRWSNQLIDLADYYYEIGDYETAIDAAKAVPPGSKVEPEAIAYLQASRAQTASKDDNALGYLQAIAYTSQVPKSAAVLETTQDDINQWEAKVQSWSQLEFAKMFTRVDQKTGYKIAIEHAALIDTENPNRIKAQSLIAQWDKQLNSVADRQTIARASQLANNTTDLASVQAAIAEARRVKVESPLRVRAQTLIAEWEGSIEKREDQPILDRAIAQAKKGDLYAAIKTADTISSNRALYDDAQDKIYDWESQIQIAEDDPILNEAAALARQGQLSAAIAKASEVGYGRALYYEAQDLIGGWIAERNRIEAARRPPEPEEQYYEPEEQYYEPEEQYYEPQSNPEPAEEPYYPPEDNYIDSASGAGSSGGPGGF